MKIAHFSWEFPPMIRGGLGTFVTELSAMQVKMGNEVTVFTMNEDNKLITLDNYKGVEVHRPKIPDFSSTFFLFADAELRQWGENFKFFADVMSYNVLSASKLVHFLVGKSGRVYDIIDAHDWLGITGGMSAKKDLKTPLIFHVHSTEKGRTRGRGSRIIEEIEYEGGEVADCIITVSEAMSDELYRLGFPPKKIRVCWNGVDTEKYNPVNVSEEEKRRIREMYGVKEDERLIFFIGRLVGVKGPDNLIKSMPSVLEEFPKTKLVLLGTGDMEDYLRMLIDEIGLSDNVVLRAEFVDESERIRHYAASDVVVLPSLYEPFGIVCTEAMSMAKPVVVGAKGTNGMREQVIPDGDRKCGLHINPYDPNDIAWGIKEVLGMEDCGAWMGRNGRERAIQCFRWDIIASKTLDIYREFLS
ncbi:MAG TPA: glycosyltransferase family 1 protein [Thermoplasmatales archaeon]|nr:glycosyltransferase family 1 protein [Thermoplasmatales archaeon]